MTPTWAGVDVGGRRKGFHVAVIDSVGVELEASLRTPREVASWLAEAGPCLVAVDSPLSPAPPGESSRAGERELVQAPVCHLRYTPDRAGLSENPRYYEWIEHGFELYAALAEAGLAAVECFPTASWTRWFGPRGEARRAAWTDSALRSLSLARVRARLNQDERDAIAAALTARAHHRGQTERFGDIVVPLDGGSATTSGGGGAAER